VLLLSPEQFVNNVVSVVSTYSIFAKLFKGRELTLTTIFTKLLRGEN
jgi:hypothetical protein